MNQRVVLLQNGMGWGVGGIGDIGSSKEVREIEVTLLNSTDI